MRFVSNCQESTLENCNKMKKCIDPPLLMEPVRWNSISNKEEKRFRSALNKNLTLLPLIRPLSPPSNSVFTNMDSHLKFEVLFIAISFVSPMVINRTESEVRRSSPIHADTASMYALSALPFITDQNENQEEYKESSENSDEASLQDPIDPARKYRMLPIVQTRHFLSD